MRSNDRWFEFQWGHYVVSLTRIILESFCGTSAKSAKQDQTSQNAASDQVLHRLLIEFSFKILNKNEKYHSTTLKLKVDSSN